MRLDSLTMKFLSGWPCGSLEQMLAACRKTRKTAINFQNGYPPTIQHSNRMEHPLVWCCTDFIGVSIIFGPNFIGFSRPCPTSIDGRPHLHRIWGANPLCEFCTQCLGCETQNETWGRTFRLLWSVERCSIPPSNPSILPSQNQLWGWSYGFKLKKSKYQASNSWSKWVDGLQFLGFWKLALIPSSKSLSKVHGHKQNNKS